MLRRYHCLGLQLQISSRSDVDAAPARDDWHVSMVGKQVHGGGPSAVPDHHPIRQRLCNAVQVHPPAHQRPAESGPLACGSSQSHHSQRFHAGSSLATHSLLRTIWDQYICAPLYFASSHHIDHASVYCVPRHPLQFIIYQVIQARSFIHRSAQTVLAALNITIIARRNAAYSCPAVWTRRMLAAPRRFGTASTCAKQCAAIFCSFSL